MLFRVLLDNVASFDIPLYKLIAVVCFDCQFRLFYIACHLLNYFQRCKVAAKLAIVGSNGVKAVPIEVIAFPNSFINGIVD